MLGEYGLYFKGKMFGLLCDDTLFVKVTNAGSEFAGRVAKASPYPNAKLAFNISAAKMREREWLSALVEVTTDALPEQKKKPNNTIRRG
jgi:TfoX/Sxy family transcriptional regulator of competence genes